MITGAKVLPMAKMFRGIQNVFLLITGLLTCPCHLPFVLPALAGLFAGTAIGAFITDNTGWLITLASLYFVGVVIYFLKGLGKKPSIEEHGFLFKRALVRKSTIPKE